MANNYCLWSLAFGPLNDAEHKWAFHRLKYLEKDWEEDITDKEHQELLDLDYDENATSLEFQWEVEVELDKGTFLIMHSDENGNILNAVAFVQELLRRFDRKDIVTITWADTCDKMRPDNFSGGAVVFNSHEARYMNSSAWAEDEAKMLKEKWLDDKVQFARLLCELVANWDEDGAKKTIKAVADSMDLEFDQVNELFDRAEKVWEAAKEKTRG